MFRQQSYCFAPHPSGYVTGFEGLCIISPKSLFLIIQQLCQTVGHKRWAHLCYFFISALFLDLGWVTKDALHNPEWVSAFLSLLHAATRRTYQPIFDVCQMCSNRRTGAWCNDRLLKRNFIPRQQPNNKPHLPSTSPASRKMGFLSVSSLWPYMVANSTEASLVVGRQSPGRRFTLFGIRFCFCFFLQSLMCL